MKIICISIQETNLSLFLLITERKVPFSRNQRLKRQILNIQQSFGLDKILNSTWHDFPIQLPLIELE